MASQILKRLAAGSGISEIIRRFNSVVDMLNGNLPGRIKLHGDDGEARNPIGGATVSSANYALDVKAASGFHGLFTHSTGSPIILAIADSGGVTASAINSGDVGVTGNLTFVGAARRILADLSNATLASRLLVQSSTVNGNTLIGALPNGTAAIAGWYAYNNSTPASATLEAVIRAAATSMQIRADSPAGSYVPIYFVTNNTLQATLSTAGTFSALGLVASATYNQGLIGSERLYVEGNALLSNAAYLLGRNAAGSAVVNLLRLNGSDIVESGQTGTRHNLLGTVVAPSIDPPTVNGQVTALSQCAAWAYCTGGGALGFGDSYNIDTATSARNSAGDFSIVWDRNFSSANYAVVVTVFDNAANLMWRVNGQIAGSADIWFYTTAGVKTDPDGFSVVAFGTLS